MNSKKKPTTAGKQALPFNRQQPQAVHFKPVVAQLKTAVPAQKIKRPVAPPVYRPQPSPQAVQAKMMNVGVNRKSPVAPHVYRPPQAPKVLQTKTPVPPRSLAQHPSPPKIAQRKTSLVTLPSRAAMPVRVALHPAAKASTRTIQRTPEEGENLKNLGLSWNKIAEQDKESKDKGEFFGHVKEIQEKLGFKVYTVWHKHDPYVGGGKNKSYKKIVAALRAGADAGKTMADLYIAWATGPLSIKALPHALQELVLIVHIAEVGRGYGDAPESLLAFMKAVSKEPSKAKRSLLWDSFKDQNVYAYTAKEDKEFEPEPMDMGDDVPDYEIPKLRPRVGGKVVPPS